MVYSSFNPFQLFASILLLCHKYSYDLQTPPPSLASASCNTGPKNLRTEIISTPLSPWLDNQSRHPSLPGVWQLQEQQEPSLQMHLCTHWTCELLILMAESLHTETCLHDYQFWTCTLADLLLTSIFTTELKPVFKSKKNGRQQTQSTRPIIPPPGTQSRRSWQTMESLVSTLE